MKTLDSTMSYPPYPDKFKAGDTAIALCTINFIDGTEHKEGDRIAIKENCVPYFNVWHHIYEKEIK